MTKKKLKDGFFIRVAGSGDWYPMTVPGSALDVFCREGILPDPYYGLNEGQCREFFRNDFEIRGTFSVTKEELAAETLLLTFYGVDTVADIFLNGEKLGHVENMHRTFVFDVKKLAKEGENLLELSLTSPIRFVESYQPQKGHEINMASPGTMDGSQYIRKPHSMYGWDWGPQLPDVGIFRDIELASHGAVRLGDTSIRQRHEDGSVTLCMETELLGDSEIAQVSYEVSAPDGQLIYAGTKTEICIPKPELWWPRGYGEQPLYPVKVLLNGGEEMKEYRIGLRTMTVSQEEDQWGEEFAIQVNGVKIFARGANYIPDDCFYSHITGEVLKRDLEAAAFANFNCLRIWGGGYYPSDGFYDLCDEYGILIWQDLMFACNIYDLTPDFIENIEAETRDNVKRMRNHACLALICGNNELETAWANWEIFYKHPHFFKRDCLVQFEYILPKAVKETAPDIFYWPSSPSSGGSLDDPRDENRGDAHYWNIWSNQLPIREYLQHYVRFCSEFGSQSLPSMKTIAAFSEEKDWSPFSRVMEAHQKNPGATIKLLYQIFENFSYPKDLASFAYVSQVVQGYAMKVATDHWRRNRGRCMGSVYWQFNDEWPGFSWSSMDYYGRYKVLHYMAREFFAPVAGSIEKRETRMGFWICNETREPVKVQARIALKNLDFTVIEERSVEGEIPALTSLCLYEKDYAEAISGREDRVFLAAEYQIGEEEQIHTDIETFVPMKHMALEDPELSITKNADGSISLQAKSFAPYCMAEGIEKDLIWDRNAVSITGAEPVTLRPVKGEPDTDVRVYELYHTCH